jgi:MoxR-like ATPase
MEIFAPMWSSLAMSTESPFPSSPGSELAVNQAANPSTDSPTGPAVEPGTIHAAPGTPHYGSDAQPTTASTAASATASTTASPSGPLNEAALLEAALFEMKKVIVGQDRAIERLFVGLLARGHVLLEGVPGLAKTLAVETLSRVIGGSFNRLQFTPDLLPADLVGTRIFRSSNESFDIEWGPVFANIVLADEINRAPAKVQSALLEVMAEHQVSIAGTTRKVPEPFLVLATQNPIESEGVYPLPEAQRDRFLMKVVVGYPTAAEEAQIVSRMGVRPPQAEQVLSLDDLVALQEAADAVHVAPAVADYAVRLVLATREPAANGLPELRELIQWGASPRATLGLVAAGRALALMRGRTYVLPQDIFDVAPDVLRHRVVPSYEALAQGLAVEQLLARLLSTIHAPVVAPSQDPTAVAAR